MPPKEELESEASRYAPVLEEYTLDQLSELSDGFWKRLEYAKVLHEKLESEGVDVRPRPSMDEDDWGDLRFGMSAEDKGEQFESVGPEPNPLVFQWDEASVVLNLIAEEGGEVLKVESQSFGENSSASLGINAEFPRLS